MYAQQFSIKKLTASNGAVFSLINIKGAGDEQNFLVVSQSELYPKKELFALVNQILKSLPDGTIPLYQPINRTYLVSSSAMDLIIACNALESVRFSGTKKNDWYIKEAVNVMESNQVVYAGKYSAPDYELLVSEGCSLAIENTMIYHKPEVIEKLKELGIPCLVEKSGNESHPLGRLEWIKLYGVLFGRESLAQDFFDNQVEKISSVLNQKKTDKTVAFFYVTKNGSINVRTSRDYIAKMIELAGGNYVPDLKLKEEDNSSTRNIQVEDFFAKAKDADIMVYNAIVDRPIETLNDLLEKNDIFEAFSAVKNKKVFCIGREFFQSTTGVTQFIADMNNVISGKDTELVYIKKVW